MKLLVLVDDIALVAAADDDVDDIGIDSISCRRWYLFTEKQCLRTNRDCIFQIILDLLLFA
jgi:hypothetical protein